MEFLRLIFILVVLATATTCSTQMQSSSNNPDPTKATPAPSDQLMPNWRQTQPAGGLVVRILHRNHPEVVRELGSPAQLAQPLQVAPLEKWENKLVYYAHFLVGSEFESVFAVYDTGSSFTWLKPRKNASSTYLPLPCRGGARTLCDEVPGNTTCVGQCRFSLAYEDGQAVAGKAGMDTFHFFKPSTGGHDPDPKHTFAARVVFGTADDYKFKHPGVIGVTKRNLGILYFIKSSSTFSSCFPLHDDAPSYLRLGEEAFLDGDSTTLRYDGLGHFGFHVDSITIQGVDFSAQEGLFIFDTGAALTHLHTKVMDDVGERVRRSVKEFPAVAPSGYELCYVPDDESALKGLEFSLHLDGGGSIPFKSEHLWIRDGHKNFCLAFHRSNKTRTIFGVWQMRGWNFGIDLDENEFFYYSDDKCGT